MEPEHLRFGGGATETVLNPLVIVVILIAGIFICFGSRNRAMAAFLGIGMLIPMDQVLLIGIFHFPVFRILIGFGLVRVAARKLFSRELVFNGGITAMDWAVVLLPLFTAINGLLLWQLPAVFIFQMGNLYTVIGAWIVLRYLIRDAEDIRHTLRVLVGIVAIVALIMISEHVFKRNIYYSFLGGARAGDLGVAAELREGRVRAYGTFQHAILAGTFGGFCLPLFLGLWWKGEKSDRKMAALGVASALILPFAASSSTALLAFLAGLVGLCMWPFRQVMRPIRWGIAIGVVALHLVMNGPVWALILRADINGGSDADHRFELVNQCILHFKDWALIGTKDYAKWGWMLYDLSNQYVMVANTAGLIPLICFLVLIVLAFRYIGLARKAAAVAGDRKQELFIWGFGASMFANVIAFFGIDYFDQIIIAWYALLAMVTAAGLAAKKAQPAESAAVSEIGPRLPLGVGRVPLQFKSSVNPIKKHNSPRGPQGLPY